MNYGAQKTTINREYRKGPNTQSSSSLGPRDRLTREVTHGAAPQQQQQQQQDRITMALIMKSKIGDKCSISFFMKHLVGYIFF
jgi:hypothetical protein